MKEMSFLAFFFLNEVVPEKGNIPLDFREILETYCSSLKISNDEKS